MMNKINFEATLDAVRACDRCIKHLPHGVRPIVQINPKAKILIAGQAPGSKVHQTGIPFDDPSGNRLRLWMGVDKMMAYIPGGILTKSAWGNTYSDFIGATIGAAIASIGQDLLNVDNTPPIWINAVGMVVGCIMGMTVGKLITGEK